MTFDYGATVKNLYQNWNRTPVYFEVAVSAQQEYEKHLIPFSKIAAKTFYRLHEQKNRRIRKKTEIIENMQIFQLSSKTLILLFGWSLSV